MHAPAIPNRRSQQRFLRAAKDGNIFPASQFNQPQGILGGIFDAAVAKNRAQSFNFTSGDWQASKNAIESSIPGSVSMIMRFIKSLSCLRCS